MLDETMTHLRALLARQDEAARGGRAQEAVPGLRQAGAGTRRPGARRLPRVGLLRPAAAGECGAPLPGLTLSTEQADLARARAAGSGFPTARRWKRMICEQLLAATKPASIEML